MNHYLLPTWKSRLFLLWPFAFGTWCKFLQAVNVSISPFSLERKVTLIQNLHYSFGYMVRENRIILIMKFRWSWCPGSVYFNVFLCMWAFQVAMFPHFCLSVIDTSRTSCRSFWWLLCHFVFIVLVLFHSSLCTLIFVTLRWKCNWFSIFPWMFNL